jgi:ribonuclease HII
MTAMAPTRLLERSLLRSGHRIVGGVDEVGRGALAGPVSVGVVVVGLGTRTAPQGLRDSKLLAPATRQALQDPIRRWCVDHEVGHASAGEIDEIGIIAALRTAALRALGALHERGTWPEAVILDGSHNWLRAPEQDDLFAAVDDSPRAALERVPTPTVHVKVKADLKCAAVAAASVLAKYERDTRMVELDAEHPGYGWAMNKGYAAPEHIEALRSRGPSPQHRISWRLPGGAHEGVLVPGMMGP